MTPTRRRRCFLTFPSQLTETKRRKVTLQDVLPQLSQRRPVLIPERQHAYCNYTESAHIWLSTATSDCLMTVSALLMIQAPLDTGESQLLLCHHTMAIMIEISHLCTSCHTTRLSTLRYPPVVLRLPLRTLATAIGSPSSSISSPDRCEAYRVLAFTTSIQHFSISSHCRSCLVNLVGSGHIKPASGNTTFSKLLVCRRQVISELWHKTSQ